MALTSTNIVDRSAFPQALASRARRLGSDATIQNLIELAESKILAGGGTVDFLISGTGNGKSGMQESRLDAVELFTLAEQALALYRAADQHGCGHPHDGAAVAASYPDFSLLSGFCGLIQP